MAIEPCNRQHAFGVVVPDLPGCFSAGDTLDQALDNVSEAIELWLEMVIDDGGAVPEPRSITEHRANPEFADWIWAVVNVDFAALSNKVERVNITLPRRILRRIDAAARQAGESRSAYIARRVLTEGRRKSA